MPDPYTLEDLNRDVGKAVDQYIADMKSAIGKFGAAMNAMEHRAKKMDDDAAEAIIIGQLRRMAKEVEKLEKESG